jgi:hypothetical protein
MQGADNHAFGFCTWPLGSFKGNWTGSKEIPAASADAYQKKIDARCVE